MIYYTLWCNRRNPKIGVERCRKFIFSMLSSLQLITRRLHRRSLRLPTRRKWAQSGYLCTTPSTVQAGGDAGISWLFFHVTVTKSNNQSNSSFLKEQRI